MLSAWDGKRAFCTSKPARFKDVDCTFSQDNSSWILTHAKKTQILGAGEYVMFNGSLFACFPSRFSCLNLETKERFMLERSPGTNPMISSRHFRIEKISGQWQIEDLQSSNGTYLNGFRLNDQHVLHPGDWIMAGGICFVFFEKYLLCSADILPDKPDISWARQAGLHNTNPGSQNRYNSPVSRDQKAEAIEVEAPAAAVVPDKPHWFSSIGPAGLILVSACASALTLYISNPEDLAAVFRSCSTSFSMAAAFLAYGLINRKLSIKQSQKPAQRQKKLYLDYLEHISQEAAAKKEQADWRFLKDRERVEGLDPSLKGSETESGCFPAGTEYINSVNFKIPKVRYDQKQDELTQKMLALKTLSLQSSCFCYIQPGGFYRAPAGAAFSMYVLWYWFCFCEQRRWAWITKEIPDILHHDGCMLEEEFLWFSSRESFEVMRQRHPQILWTVWTDTDDPSMKKAGAEKITWIGPSLRGPDVQIIQNPLLLPKDRIDQTLRLGRDQENPPKMEFRDSDMNDPDIHIQDFRSSQAKLSIRLSADVMWDLEKEGPHVLVAGTTGSGKSEGLIHILSQLALYNDPSQVQFLLIDFKGGAFAGTFENYPHLAGLITNLEERSFDRLEQAMNLELSRRQKLLAEFQKEHPYETADLETYNRNSPEAIAHVFIVVDEFGELRRLHPSAMQALQESARIGRSLGIHLILSTQKPAGIVDEQIWSNSKSKLCFMVNSISDSREVLANDRAASLKQPGEFVLQVSGQREVCSRMDYVRAPVCEEGFVQEWDEGHQLLYEHKPASRLETITRLVLSQKISHSWILHPDPSHADFKEAPVLLDQIRYMEAWKPKESCWIQAPDAILEKAAACLAVKEKRPVYTCGFELEQTCQQIPARNLWQLNHLKNIYSEPALVLIKTSQCQIDIIQPLFENPNLSLVFLSSENPSRWNSILSSCAWRFACECPEKEWNYTLFQSIKTVNTRWPLMQAWHAGNFYSAGFDAESLNRKHNKPDQARIPLIQNPVKLSCLRNINLNFSGAGLLAGFETRTGRPVFWDPNKPLLIVWSQSSVKKDLLALLESWQKQKPDLKIGPFPGDYPVSLLELPKGQNLLSSPQGSAQLYERELCFIGKGIRDYQYLLKTGMAASGMEDPCIYFGKEAVGFELARFEEEEGG